MNDSATGANLDSMQEHYHVDYDKISIVFLANTAGYFLSSMSSSFMLHHFGLQTSLLVACAGMSIGCVVLSIAPPFPAFIVMLMFMGFGSGVSLRPPFFLEVLPLTLGRSTDVRCRESTISQSPAQVKLIQKPPAVHHHRHRTRGRRRPDEPALLVLRSEFTFDERQILSHSDTCCAHPARRHDLSVGDRRVPRPRVRLEPVLQVRCRLWNLNHPNTDETPQTISIPLGISILLAVIGFLVFRGCESSVGKKSLGRFSADPPPLLTDIPPPDEAHEAPLSTAQAPGSVVHEHANTATQGEVVHARSKMSAQQRMKRAFGIRAVWVGIVLIVFA